MSVSDDFSADNSSFLRESAAAVGDDDDDDDDVGTEACVNHN